MKVSDTVKAEVKQLFANIEESLKELRSIRSSLLATDDITNIRLSVALGIIESNIEEALK